MSGPAKFLPSARFWIIKILATTLGERGGDAVTMTSLGETTRQVPDGYLVGTAIFGLLLVLLVWVQIRARRFNPWLYWATIVASTTCGRTLGRLPRPVARNRPSGADRCCCSPACSCRCSPGTGRWARSTSTASSRAKEPSTGSRSPSRETPGTALGDWIADAGLGYSGGALVFGACLAVLAILYFRTGVSRAALFWAAFILTRPLEATVGDFLDKPVAKGGLERPRPLASAVLAVWILLLVLILPRRPGRHPGEGEAPA